jgi:hypothetical protein
VPHRRYSLVRLAQFYGTLTPRGDAVLKELVQEIAQRPAGFSHEVGEVGVGELAALADPGAIRRNNALFLRAAGN